MYTGNVWFAALVIAGFLGALVAFQLLMAAVFRDRAERSTAALRERPFASLFAGAGILVVTIFLLAVFSKLGGFGKFAGVLVAAFVTFPLVLGLGAVSRCVGDRMPSRADDGQPWRATLRGGVTCGLAFVTPAVGWFLVLPAAVSAGLGAVLLGAMAGAPSPAEPAAAPSPEPPPSPPPLPPSAPELPDAPDESAGASV